MNFPLSINIRQEKNSSIMSLHHDFSQQALSNKKIHKLSGMIVRVEIQSIYSAKPLFLQQQKQNKLSRLPESFYFSILHLKQKTMDMKEQIFEMDDHEVYQNSNPQNQKSSVSEFIQKKTSEDQELNSETERENQSFGSNESKEDKTTEKKTEEAAPRTSNYILPNTIRSGKLSIKVMLKGEYSQVQSGLTKFWDKMKVKYQFWGFEAMLVSLIYLRDKAKLIGSKKYNGILELIKSRLNINLSNTSDEEAKKTYQLFIEHVKLYSGDNAKYDSICARNSVERESFYGKLVKKRTNCVSMFVKYIRGIEKQLNEGTLQQMIQQQAKNKL